MVYLQQSRERPVAVKVFCGDPVADAVHWLLSGAPNPYRWCEDAIRAAYHRRRVLAALVRFWFGEQLVVADALGVEWDAENRAWTLQTRYLPGSPVALHHPFSTARDHEQRELVNTILRPLQHRLAESGFDGLLWQAGLGNPVALNNFLVLERRRSRGSRATRYAWIDLESGVPALFPANPVTLVRTYLPACIKHGRPLFDDVDIDRLHAYVADNERELTRCLGEWGLRRLREEILRLGEHQGRWRRLGRLERSLQAAVARGDILSQQLPYYRGRPGRWLAYELGRMARRTGSEVAVRASRTWQRIRRVPIRNLVAAAVRFSLSQRQRRRIARAWTLRRIRAWRQRHQLTSREVNVLRRLTTRDDAAAYLTDFTVHLAIKPPSKAVAWLLVPILADAGWIPFGLAVLLVILAGSVSRTLYTAWRMLGAARRATPLPWTALAVGLLPIVGTSAYPLQVVRDSRTADSRLAGFILYDVATSIGRRVPIWGGEDTAIEHACNRLVDRLVPHRAPLLRPTLANPNPDAGSTQVRR